MFSHLLPIHPHIHPKNWLELHTLLPTLDL
jgi:hypothetical protein